MHLAHKTIYALGILIFLLNTNLAYSQKYKFKVYDNISAEITVNEADNSLTANWSKSGFIDDASNNTYHIAYTELESINNISVEYTNLKGKTKKLKNTDIADSSISTNSFYDGIRAKVFKIPIENEFSNFKLSYKKNSEETFLLPNFYLNSRDSVEQYSYTIKYKQNSIPIYKLYGDTSTLKSFSVKHNQIEKTLTIQSKPLKKIESPERKHHSLHPATPMPHVKVAIVPVSDKDKPFEYFNYWYKNLVEEKGNISSSTLNAITSDISADEQFAAAVFRKVQNSISYIAIENGIGAIQPRDVNLVYQRKMGDCKDMSNLLNAVLKNNGDNSSLALSASLSHRTDLDFPEVSSANHAICVYEISKDSLIYLDATDEDVYFGWPSRHIQNRNIFVINDDGGYLHKVKAIPAIKNKSEYKFDLKIKDRKLSGIVEIDLHGYSALPYKSILNTISDKEKEAYLNNQLEHNLGSLSFDKVELSDKEKQVVIYCDATLPVKLTTIKDKLLIPAKAFPLPHKFPLKIEKDEKLITYQTLLNEFEFKIQLEDNYTVDNKYYISETENGILFNWQAKVSNDNILEINYSYHLEHVDVNGEIRKSYNKINGLIEKRFNETIILRKK